MPEYAWVKLGAGGSIVIPASFRDALRLDEGDDLQIRLEGDELRVLTKDSVIQQVQEQVRRYVPKDVSVVDELLAERRAEAEKEDSRRTESTDEGEAGSPHTGGKGGRS